MYYMYVHVTCIGKKNIIKICSIVQLQLLRYILHKHYSDKALLCYCWDFDVTCECDNALLALSQLNRQLHNRFETFTTRFEGGWR